MTDRWLWPDRTAESLSPHSPDRTRQGPAGALVPLAEAMEPRLLLSVAELTLNPGDVYDLSDPALNTDEIVSLTINGGSLIHTGGSGGDVLTVDHLYMTAGSIDLEHSHLNLAGGSVSGASTIAVDNLTIEGDVALGDDAALAFFNLDLRAGGVLDVSAMTAGYTLPAYTTVFGSGEFQGSVVAGDSVFIMPGSFDPGARTGSLGFGDLQMGWDTYLSLDLEGTTPGAEYDQIRTTGQVALNGAWLELLGESEHVFGPGQTFVLLDNAQPVVGRFVDSRTLNVLQEGDVFTIPTPNGNVSFKISYGYGGGNDVAITYWNGETPPANTQPVAGNDQATTGKDTPLVLSIADLMANDSDADGDPLSFVTAWGKWADSGSVVIDEPAGTITYTPVEGFVGIDTISYSIADGRGGFATADVTIQVMTLAELGGLTFLDINNDSVPGSNEPALPNVLVTLTGLTDAGGSVSQTQLTDADGVYFFRDLQPGVYQVHETQPGEFPDGRDTAGTLGGTVGADTISNIRLAYEDVAENYNFAEQDVRVYEGQAASIGFWQNRNGQALIRSLNGGQAATDLGNWLGTNFPNLFGSLDGLTNAQVADTYRALFRANWYKVETHVLATALSTYVTSSTLAGDAASAYGFAVTTYGLGLSTISVGISGAAFGVANNTVLSIQDILEATDDRSAGGVAYGGHVILSLLAQLVYLRINLAGSM